jgi:phage FluMu protein Com
MPIEFRCTQCNRLLRTQDETAGKKAKCPECGAILTIPTPGAAPEASTPPPPPPAGPQSPFQPTEPLPTGPASPFAPGAAPGAAPDSENPYASPTDYTVGAPAAYAPPGRIAPTQIEMGDVFGRTWDIIKEQWGMCLGLVLVAWLINVGVNLAAGMIPFFGGIISWLFSVWIWIGVAMGLLKIARGQETSIGDIFNGGPYFLRILGASILYGLMVGAVFAILFVPGMVAVMLALQGGDEAVIIFALVGLGLVCWIPALVVSLIYSQFYYLIIDQDVGIMESLSLSKQIMMGNKLTVFVIWVLMGLLNLAGILACCVGLLFTIPFTAMVNLVVYLAMTGQPTGYRGASGPPTV